MPTLLNEFCTVKVLVGLENLSALQNSEVSKFGRALVSNRTAAKRLYKRGVHYREHPLREVPLYLYTYVGYTKQGYMVNYIIHVHVDLSGCLTLCHAPQLPSLKTGHADQESLLHKTTIQILPV